MQQAVTTNFKLVIEYDGTPFSGWQVQKERPTVQGELEKAISCILNQPVKINGSGRTDAGVHAMGQVASFTAHTVIPPDELKKGVNAIINGPVVIRNCSIVPPQFHARYQALSKEYHYHILNRPDPCAVKKNFLWHVKQPLDLDTMNRCCALIQGLHDFKSFEASGSPRFHTRREVYSARVDTGSNDELVFKIEANGFLRFMVRNLVGTLVLAGQSKISPEEFKKILLAKNRSLAGATAPPRGLFLMQVNY
ncbi:MAG: tRNA pseudouridine(38-40) synthase TruA [Desulfobacteraceae bacterium]